MNGLIDKPTSSIEYSTESPVTPQRPAACDSYVVPLQHAQPEELERRVWNFLHHRQVESVDLLHINHFGGGVIRIRGCAESRYSKWLIINCCQRVAGVRRVVDQIRVGKTAQHTPMRETRPLCQ